MKNILRLILAFLLPIAGLNTIFAQSITSQVSTNFFVEAYNIRGRPFTNKDALNVEGTPLLNNEWKKGTVYFKDGSVSKDVELKFNLEKNELYFNRNGEMFIFNDPITSFRLETESEGKSGELLFRSGYPANGRHNKESFYEIVADGAKFQVINFRFCYLADAYVYGGTSKKKFTPNEELYIVDVAFGKITRIKRAEASVVEAMPDLKNKISQICSTKRLKMKTNADLIILFNELNNL
jgi:hypothetical protein